MKTLLAIIFTTTGLVFCAALADAQNGDARLKNQQAQIATLRNETLQETMDSLISDDQQYFGYNTDIKYAQTDLETLLSARRSVKVLQSIESLPEKEREAKCRQFFSKAFQVHTNAIYTVLKHEDNPASPENKLSMLATQESICAAMFITADIGRLDLLSEQFAQLDHLQNELKPLLAANKAAHPQGPAFVLEIYSSPDNRLQVNVLRLAAARFGNADMLKQVDAECVLAKMRTREISIAAWDALPTWNNLVPGIPIDTSKGVSKFVFYDWQSPGDFPPKDLEEKLVLKLRSIVLH